jgi:hypothetical protein
LCEIDFLDATFLAGFLADFLAGTFLAADFFENLFLIADFLVAIPLLKGARIRPTDRELDFLILGDKIL